MFNHVYRFMFEYHARIFYDFRGTSTKSQSENVNSNISSSALLEGGEREK